MYEQAPPQAPSWAGRTWVLPLALLASLAAVVVSPLAWLGVGAVLYALIAIQMRYHAKIQLWEQQAHALQMLLRVHGLLGTGEGLLRSGFAQGREQARRINVGLSRSMLSKNVPGVGEYADWFLLSNVKHYFRSVELVFAEREFLRESYLLCADLEADVALARHLLAAQSWCWAERGAPRELLIERGEHPLLDDAVPLSIALDAKGAFISGQNGIGKSTFLRTVGLNVVVARAFGFCYASRALLPALAVHASMQNEDSLLGGESLYVAELRRAKELLAKADGPEAGIYLVDEIFRGTNHVESVSAAAAVLDVLAERGLVLVSSHNLILAPLLAHRLDAYCLGRNSEGQVLLPGVLNETNGVALLAQRGFDKRVEQRALQVARWLGEYMAAPADCAHLLQPREAVR
jgi:DNA mismatch repair ATPase MutS